MTSLLLASDYFRKVRVRRYALQLLFKHHSYDDVGREAQEIVELALKGALRCLGVEPPKRHDVAPYLSKVEGLPLKWRRRLAKLKEISEVLAEERSHAFYGDEASDQPASALFGVHDAKQAMQWADLSITFLSDLLKQGSVRRGPARSTSA
jgi:HEPN domain-containing protein